MAKCHHRSHNNNVGSLPLDRPATSSRLWASFSTATLRRIVLDAMSCGSSSRHHQEDNNDNNKNIQKSQVPETQGHAMKQKEDIVDTTACMNKNNKTEKLSDLLNLGEIRDKSQKDVDVKKKEEALERLKMVVKELQADEVEKRNNAVSDVRKLVKDDGEARITLANLGAIPVLVGMLEMEDLDSFIDPVYALLNLGIGNDLNKAAIVKAGAVHKMLKLVECSDDTNLAVCEAIVANFLALSALDSNKPVIGASGAIPFLVKTLKSVSLDKKSSSQAKQDALRALYNLSLFPANNSFILETDLVPCLLNALGDMEVSERILAILSNVVSTAEGRKAISKVPDAFPILIDVLNWTDAPGCQEKVSYILMVMAHKACGDRQAMIDAGIMSSLLELTLLGSTLAQKRASRILECLRVDKGKQVSESFGGNLGATVSAPIVGSSSSTTNPNGGSRDCLEDDDMMSEEKKAVKRLVQQSLQNNMKRIVKRANLPQDFVPSEHFKSLTASSTSKSLPL